MSDVKLDFSFDARVADRYDAQRALPPDVSRTIGRVIADIAGADARILELGVGTGRIALPVAAAGCEVVGIDISADMLAQVQAGAAGMPLQVVRGDITKLPFQPASFDAVTAVHVFHLVENWQRVIDDMATVLKPQSKVIMGRDWTDPESMSGQLQNSFRRIVMSLATGQLKPPAGWGQIAERLAQHGFEAVSAGSTDIVAAEWNIEMSPRNFIDGVRNRSNPESWILSDELMEPVVAQLEQAADEQWPDRDKPRTVRRRFLITVFARQIA